MNKNHFWIQIRDYFAKIFTLNRVLYSLFLGSIFSWLTRGELAPIILGGKTFSGRSEWVQVAIIVFLATLYTVLFVCLSYVIPSSFYSQLNAVFIKPIYEGCRDTLLEVKSILEILHKPNKLTIIIRKVSELPDLYWILGSYLAAYFLYFISPVFLNSGQRMSFRVDYFAATPIGADLRAFLSFGRAFFVNHGEYPPGNLYPPLFTLLISPFASMDPASVYNIFVPIILLSYFFITLVIPALIVRNQKGFLLLAAFFLTGLFSHGFYFELERGQLNVVAFLFVLTAIYLFHYKPRLRFLAYLLFSIGVHIKISPVIFIFMFIDNWKGWRTNLKRFAGICVLNLALLFVLGYHPAFALLTNLQTATSNNADYVWIGNHSIMSFSMLLQAGYFRDILSGFHLSGFNTWAMENGAHIWNLMTMLVLVCYVGIVFNSYKRNTKGFNLYLFVVSTLVLLLVPPISNDYTLSILGSAVGIALATRLDADTFPNYRLLWRLLVSLIAFAYSTTLYSFEYKPGLFQSNLVALIIMLFCFTIMALLPNPAIEVELNRIENRLLQNTSIKNGVP